MRQPLTKIHEFLFHPVELTLAEAPHGKTIPGIAAVYSTESRIGNMYRVKLRFGAMTKTLEEYDQRALWNHDPNFILGRKSAGTLRLTDSEAGLYTEIDLPNSPNGQNALEAVNRRDVTGMSIGFNVIQERWEDSDTDIPLRELIEIKLVEVSPTPWPQFPETNVGEAYSEAYALEHGGLTPQEILARARARGLLSATNAPDQNHPDEPGPEIHAEAGDPLSPEDWRIGIYRRRLQLTARY